MSYLVKKASALSTEEKAARNLTGIPDEWPIESYIYTNQPINGDFILMTDTEYRDLRANNRAAYDAWANSRRPIVVAPPEQPTTTTGVPIVEVALRKGQAGASNFTIVSPDFSDRTSWYQKSVEVLSDILTPNAERTEFTGTNINWINMNSEKLTVDYKKVLERDGSLTDIKKRLVTVKVDDVVIEDGFTIDFPAGKVIFEQPQAGEVTAKYWHNNNVQHCSEFLLTPPPGFAYRINHIECQFSRNTGFNDNIVIEIWAGAVGAVGGKPAVNLAGYGNFIDAYYDAGYGQSRSIYRNLKDLINWCTNAYPVIQSCGELTQDIMCFPFLYIIHPEISSKQGTVIRLLNKKDIPLDAEISTVTFYMEKFPV